MAEGFAAIPTWMIRDTRIPRNALLVYAALSSRSGYREIYPSQETIAEESGLTDRTVRKMLKELEALGVLTRQRRRVKGTRRAPDGYLLHPNGLPEDSSGSSDLPEAERASTGNETQVTPLYTDRESEIDNPQTPRGGESESSSLIEEQFLSFWTIYPRKAGKSAAEKAFVKASKALGSSLPILDGARRFAQDPNLPEPRFIPHPATWLNAGRWEDEPLPSRAGGQQGTAADRMIQQITANAAQSTDWSRRGIEQ